MTNEIDADDDVIDSRDVIARIEELEGDALATVEEAAEAAGWSVVKVGDYWEAQQASDSDPDATDNEYHCDHELEAWGCVASELGLGDTVADELDELRKLRVLAEQCEGCGDWECGEQLIAEHHFTGYIEQLIDDCYEMPAEMKSGNWPWRHVSIDYEAAANEAKADYDEVTFGGRTFLIRC